MTSYMKKAQVKCEVHILREIKWLIDGVGIGNDNESRKILWSLYDLAEKLISADMMDEETRTALSKKAHQIADGVTNG